MKLTTVLTLTAMLVFPAVALWAIEKNAPKKKP